MDPVRGSVQTLMSRRWLILSAVSVGTFMATLDGSIVNISLPSIQAAFGIDLSVVEWVSIAYLVVVGSVLLPFGRLGEVITFRRVYLVGFAVFTLASALCAAAPGAGALIAFRIVQGVGAGMLQAMGPAIVARTFGPGERGRALGLNAISVALGLTLGPVLGGVLTELATWRAVFLVNLPVGILAIAWAARVLPDERRSTGQTFDIPGAVLSGTALLTLLLALTQGESLGWTSPVIIALLVTATVTAATFLWQERRTAQPLIDLRLFRIRAFTAGNASVVIAFAGLFTATFLLPFLLERGAGYAPIEAGLLLTPIPVIGAIVAPFSGALSDRIGSRLPASVGIAVMAVGLLSLSQLEPGFSPLDLTWRLSLIGLGQGLFMSPNSSAVLGSVPPPRIGTASGTLAQMRIDGQALGIAASGAIVSARMSAHLAELTALGPAEGAARAMALGIRDAFVIAGLVCAIGIATSLVRGGRADAQEITTANAPGRPEPP
jgi:EmrB/QacA subfamily drug resistance transporter